MIDGKVQIKFNRLPQMQARVPVDVERGLRALAQEGRNRVVLSLQERSPGTTRTRYSPRRTVVVAAPGETPNTDTGALVAGIATEARGQFQHAIISRAEYSQPLEFGTARMAARPFMTPMAESLAKDAPTFFKDFFA